MTLVCALPECPVAVTGKCLKSHSPVESCPHFLAGQARTDAKPPIEQLELSAVRTVYSGHELGALDAASIMAAQYTHLIGVLGEVDTGKTCMLCSMYLLASCGQLAPAHRFAGSLTLRGYESRLRHYRTWAGPLLPDRITPHTELAHPRSPGFLHLALSAGPRVPRLYNMLFSDLPGEWTSAFINSSLAGDKLHFLRRADALVLAFRADHLRDSHTRHSQYQSARLLLQRLRESGFTSPNTPLIIAVTRADLVERVLPPAAHEIASTAQDLGFTDVPTIAIASFSANPSVPSGLGLGDLLKTLLRLTRSRVSGARRERGERLFDLYKHRAQVV